MSRTEGCVGWTYALAGWHVFPSFLPLASSMTPPLPQLVRGREQTMDSVPSSTWLPSDSLGIRQPDHMMSSMSSVPVFRAPGGLPNGRQ